MAKTWSMFVDGKWVPSESGKTFGVINPATEALIAEVPLGSRSDAQKAIDVARETFDRGVWSEKTPAERSKAVWKLADLVEQNIDEIASLEAQNVGKTIRYSRESDLPFLIDNLRFFAGAARALEGKSADEYSGMGTSFIRREPLGVVAGIIPWNYPRPYGVPHPKEFATRGAREYQSRRR